MIGRRLLLLGSAALLACSDPSPVSPSPATCHSMSASAFSVSAYQEDADDIRLVIELQGDSDDEFPAAFAYGVAAVQAGGSIAPVDECFINEPFGTLNLDLIPTNDATAMTLSVPVNCQGGFADGTRSLNVIINLTSQAADAGTSTTQIVSCDGGLITPGPSLPVQVSPAQ